MNHTVEHDQSPSYHTSPSGRLHFINPLRLALLDEKRLDLTESEYLIFETLAEHSGYAFERRELIDASLGSQHDVDNREIDTYVKSIRAKLLALSKDSDFIKTIHGHGYRFEDGKFGAYPSENEAIALWSSGSTVVIDHNGHRAFVDGVELDLTESEYLILRFLAENTGQDLDNERISRACFGVGFIESGRKMASHIKNLRKKLGDPARNPKWIRTIHAYGYRFEGIPINKIKQQ